MHKKKDFGVRMAKFLLLGPNTFMEGTNLKIRALLAAVVAVLFAS
jgi:hypothetical protein